MDRRYDGWPARRDRSYGDRHARSTWPPPMSGPSGSGLLSRRLAAALEPVTGQVYFSPECHAAYEKLGFAASPGTLADGVHLPDGAAYFTSRGSVMGQVPGEVVAAAFAVFNPQAVIPAVAYGWTKCDADTICHARTAGARAQLIRILGDRPTGLARATE